MALSSKIATISIKKASISDLISDLLAKGHPPLCLSCGNDMATFTTLVKIYSIEYFCNTKVGEIFVQRKLSAVWYKLAFIKLTIPS